MEQQVKTIRIKEGKPWASPMAAPEKLEIDINQKQPSSIVGKFDELKAYNASFVEVGNPEAVFEVLWNNHPESDFYGKGLDNFKKSLYNFRYADYPAPEGLTMSVDNDHTWILAFGLKTRTWTLHKDYGYGCSECCNGDRCDDDCVAKYKRQDKNCPHCQGKGWIKQSDVTLVIGKVATVKFTPAEKEEKPDFGEWLKSVHGIECMLWPVTDPKYLENRLFWAFDAGRDRIWDQYMKQKQQNQELQQEITTLRARIAELEKKQ